MSTKFNDSTGIVNLVKLNISSFSVFYIDIALNCLEITCKILIMVVIDTETKMIRLESLERLYQLKRIVSLLITPSIVL